MKKVIMLKGLPASGKSVFASNQCNCIADTVRVNKDDIRAMMVAPFSKGNEKIVLAVRDTVVREALSQNKTVIVDDTNFATIHEETLRTIAAAHDAPFEVKTFDTPVDECIKRDAKRANPVGRDVIMDMYRKYVKPLPELREYIPHLTNCTISDLDGTLAIKGDRGIYDFSKVGVDKLNVTVLNAVTGFMDASNVGKSTLLIVSGREDSCKEETLQWLRDYRINATELHMRKTGDKRPDYVVKQEIYDNYIKDKYNVLAVFDDRDSVVRMWRDNGLPVFQVNEGNF